ncbi:MAG: hypothetical protein RO009_02765 [Pseudorhodoplanes sp.]|jgi:hypothetical protein|nr:hypothetical protein [Pseudorhodoplanes sp.]
MWGKKGDSSAGTAPAAETPQRLKEAVRAARIESAERMGVVVELRDAELARLELLNEALDPIFKEIPADIDLFDRGLSRGDTPRLWIDAIAFVEMGRDKRHYRFLQDTRYGRKILSESPEIGETTGHITRYLARRLVERERALESDGDVVARAERAATQTRRRQRWRVLGAFLLGILFTITALFALAWWAVRV